MARPEVSVHEISVKVADRQFAFLENRAKELGVSKEELVKLYIARAIDAEREHKTSETKQFSLMGIVRDGRVTDAEIDEVIAEWSKTE